MKLICVGSISLNFMQGFLTISMYTDNQKLQDNKSKNTILKILPIAAPGPLVIDGPSGKIHESYLKSLFSRVVNLHENYSWLNIKDNYKEILEYHASLKYENFLKANLEQTGFVNQVISNKMISTFEINKNEIMASWCEKLGVACAVISGKRRVFTGGNKPLDETNVSYFMLSGAVMPNAQNLNVLQIDRLIVFDRGENPKERAEALYKAALEGKIPENKI